MLALATYNLSTKQQLHQLHLLFLPLHAFLWHPVWTFDWVPLALQYQTVVALQPKALWWQQLFDSEAGNDTYLQHFGRLGSEGHHSICPHGDSLGTTRWLVYCHSQSLQLSKCSSKLPAEKMESPINLPCFLYAVTSTSRSWHLERE